MYTTAGTKLMDPIALLRECGVSSGARVADLGCGKVGQFVFPAAIIVGEDGMVYAADIQKTAVDAIQEAAAFRHLANVHSVWTDLEQYGMAHIPEGTIDVALMVTTLLHSKNREAMVNEAKRLIKPGGILIIIDWLPDALKFMEPDTTPVSQDEVVEIAQSLGFSLVNELTPGKFHFGYRFEKS